jgi:hypothetical protein
MNNDTIARGTKTVLSRWESRNGRKFIELYQQDRNGRTGYGYDSHMGSFWFGSVSMRQAFEKVEQDRNLSVTHLTQIPVAFSLAA